MAACNIGIVTFKDIDLSSRIGILKKSTQVYMMLKRMLRYAFLITQCVWNYGIIKSKHTEIIRQPNQAFIPRQSYFNIVGDCITHVDVITLVFHCKRPI